MTTPADELRSAAEKLRTAATAADAKRPGPWTPGAAGSVISPREGGVNYVTGYTTPDGPEVAAYIALMGPDVGDTIAQWLDAERRRLNHSVHPDWQDVAAHHALAVARAINGDAR